MVPKNLLEGAWKVETEMLTLEELRNQLSTMNPGRRMGDL